MRLYRICSNEERDKILANHRITPAGGVHHARNTFGAGIGQAFWFFPSLDDAVGKFDILAKFPLMDDYHCQCSSHDRSDYNVVIEYDIPDEAIVATGYGCYSGGLVWCHADCDTPEVVTREIRQEWLVNVFYLESYDKLFDGPDGPEFWTMYRIINND